MSPEEIKSMAYNVRRFLSAADDVAREIAPILIRRLRKCDSNTLKMLKRELRDFNIHTEKWSDQ